MKKRLNFLCWKCGRKYSLLQEIHGRQELIVACPYCNQEAVVQLEPFRKEIKKVYRGTAQAAPVTEYEYRFPELIPTQKPD